MIRCGNPLAQYRARKAEIDAAVLRVLESGRYILGEEVRRFEGEFGAFVGVPHAIAVASGTDALQIALRACGIGSGDEVITVAHTAVATVAAIELCGATPVLVDIEPNYYTMNPEKLEAAIGPKTKAIVPVHLYGQPVDLNPILEVARRQGIRVMEDCAQAHGATYKGRRVGSFGDLGCFSFYPTKNLGAMGDGGIIVTADPGLAERARLLREYGWAERYVSRLPGLNSRLDEVQAAILRVKLGHLDMDNARRARLAALYGEGLSETGLGLPMCRPGVTHVYHLYVVRANRRDALQGFLASRQIGALIHYPVPVHMQPAYRDRLRGADRLPESERAAREVLSLPIYAEMLEDDVQAVVKAVHAFQEQSRD